TISTASRKGCASSSARFCGSLPDWEGLYLASGHSYHGILLAPATAQAVADLLEHGTTQLPIQPFKPERFRPQEVS
ncbi:MAG: hypothetical protein WHT28_09520, partial [Fimbriimonadales bacterium]